MTPNVKRILNTIVLWGWTSLDMVADVFQSRFQVCLDKNFYEDYRLRCLGTIPWDKVAEKLAEGRWYIGAMKAEGLRIGSYLLFLKNSRVAVIHSYDQKAFYVVTTEEPSPFIKAKAAFERSCKQNVPRSLPKLITSAEGFKRELYLNPTTNAA